MLDLDSTGPPRYAIDEHGTGSALSHSTTEFRSGEFKIVPENPKQGFIGLSLYSAFNSVDIQGKPGFCQFKFS